MSPPGGRTPGERLRATPVLHLADQVLSSGTNFLAVVVVAHRTTPAEFGVFSIFLLAFFVTATFDRTVPHAVAMTVEWDDERARSGSFFLPALVIGCLGTLVMVPTLAVLDADFVLLAFLLLPMLLQDAGRMHAFAVQRPRHALISDTIWLAVAAVGCLATDTAAGAAGAWAVGGLAGFIVFRPWLIRVRRPRGAESKSLLSATIEFGTVTGLGYLTPLVAAPIITVAGVGALQGANVIRGPFLLLVQGLILHRMAGPPIAQATCVREAARLSMIVLGASVFVVPPMILLRDAYGPPLLGSTWPAVEPLVVPALLTMVVGSVAFGPLTVVRKMGRFPLAAMVQLALAPFFFGLPLVGAALGGTQGFLYATAVAYAIAVLLWWTVLPRVAALPSGSSGPHEDLSTVAPWGG